MASRSSRSNRSRDRSRSSARNRRVGVAGPSRTQIAHPSRSRPHTNVRPVTWSSSSGASTSPSLGGDSGSPLTVRLTHDDHHRHCSVYPPVARRYCDSRRRANWPSRHCRRPVRLPDSLAPGEPPYLRARLWAPMPQLLRSRDPIRSRRGADHGPRCQACRPPYGSAFPCSHLPSTCRSKRNFP